MIKDNVIQIESTQRRVMNLKLVGGAVCLDFANTVDWHTSAHPVEMLDGYPDLVLWGRRVGIIGEKEGDLLRDQAAEFPDQAHKVFLRADRLRQAVFSIFRAVTMGQAPQNRDLKLLNTFLAKDRSVTRLVYTNQGFSWESECDPSNLEGILYPIARSAGDLLVSEDLKKVKICLDEDCGWLFLDTSRNQRRCWCDMRDCGNRAKARRFYDRRKKKDEKI